MSPSECLLKRHRKTRFLEVLLHELWRTVVQESLKTVTIKCKKML